MTYSEENLVELYRAFERFGPVPVLHGSKPLSFAPWPGIIFEPGTCRPAESQLVASYPTLKAMFHPPGHWNTPNIQEGFEVVRLSSPDELEPWMNIVKAIRFHGHPLHKKLFHQLILDPRMFFMLGKWKGKAITACLIFESLSVGIYLVSMLPAYRRKGFARQLLLKALSNYPRFGEKTITLQATEMSYSLFKKMGFRITESVEPHH